MIKFLAGITLLLSIPGCTEINKEKPAIVPTEKLIESLRLFDLQNNRLDLRQYKGKTLFLNIWATWCKPCIEEMPSIEKAQRALQNEPLVFLLASAESIEEIAQFRDAQPYNFKYARIENSEQAGIEVLPTTIIFNREGELVFIEPGSRKWDAKKNIDMMIKFTNE